jgi:hypothetical protein
MIDVGMLAREKLRDRRPYRWTGVPPRDAPTGAPIALAQVLVQELEREAQRLLSVVLASVAQPLGDTHRTIEAPRGAYRRS